MKGYNTHSQIDNGGNLRCHLITRICFFTSTEIQDLILRGTAVSRSLFIKKHVTDMMGSIKLKNTHNPMTNIIEICCINSSDFRFKPLHYVKRETSPKVSDCVAEKIYTIVFGVARSLMDSTQSIMEDRINQTNHL